MTLHCLKARKSVVKSESSFIKNLERIIEDRFRLKNFYIESGTHAHWREREGHCCSVPFPQFLYRVNYYPLRKKIHFHVLELRRLPCQGILQKRDVLFHFLKFSHQRGLLLGICLGKGGADFIHALGRAVNLLLQFCNAWIGIKVGIDSAVGCWRICSLRLRDIQTWKGGKFRVRRYFLSDRTCFTYRL